MPGIERDEARLRELEALRAKSLVNREFEAFDELLSNDLLHVHSTGVRMNKQQLCEYVRGNLRFLSITRPELSVTVKGDVALMTGVMSNRLQAPGKDPIDANSHVTQVWLRENAGWKLAIFHATRVAE